MGEMRRCFGFVVLSLLPSVGCSSGSAPSDPYEYERDSSVGYDTGRSDSAVDTEPPPDPTQCRNAVCNPPPCCGDDCGSGCCKGTVCGTSGKCIPDECSACGEVGCSVNFTTCTATCNKPSCCSKTCSTDADCCAGARCSDTTTGGRACFPTSCDRCSGMTSTCRLSADCGTECIPPASCGKTCSGDAECGTGSFCNEFNDGVKKCVPNAFKAQCSACGATCTFYGSDCRVECPSTPPVDSGTPTFDTSTPFDTSTTEPLDTSTSVEDTGTPPTSTCASCCEPCGPGLPPCCSGSICGKDSSGNAMCVPSLCNACDHGCKFNCPLKN